MFDDIYSMLVKTDMTAYVATSCSTRMTVLPRVTATANADDDVGERDEQHDRYNCGNKVVDVDRSEHDERGCDLMLIYPKDSDDSDDGNVLAQGVTIA